MPEEQEFIIDHATGQKFPLIRVKPAPQDEVKTKMPDLNSTIEELIREYGGLNSALKLAQEKPLTKKELLLFQRKLIELKRREKVLFVRRGFGKIPISQKLQTDLKIIAQKFFYLKTFP